MNTTKVTKLTAHQVSALKAGVATGALSAEVSKTTATFGTDAREAATAIRTYQEVLAAKSGRKGGDYQALHGVARKLENGKDLITTNTPTDEERAASLAAETGKPKLELVADSTDKSKGAKGVFGPSVDEAVKEETAKRNAQQAADEILRSAGYVKVTDKPGYGTAKSHKIAAGDSYLFYGLDSRGDTPELRVWGEKPTIHASRAFWGIKLTGGPAKPEKAQESKKAAPAKKSAGARAIPTEAANKARQAYITEVGLDTYKKQYNTGWDNATYGTGAKKAESGEATVGYMDGYTDRQANPGKEGIAAKWDALRSNKAPVKKVAAKAEKKA